MVDLDHASYSLHSFYVHDYVYSTFPKEINSLCEWSSVSVESVGLALP